MGAGEEKRRQLDKLSVGEMITEMNREDENVISAVNNSLGQIEEAIEAIVDVMSKGGRLFYIGAGSSGRIGLLDAAECPPTFGVSEDLVQGIIAGGDEAIRHAVENSEDSLELGRENVREKVRDKDVLVGIAASGTTPFVMAGLQEANDIGAVTVSISCRQQTKISEVAKYPIEVLVGEEVLRGSTRLKAGTAQKMVVNMITTTTMIQLGKVYGDLMVNVQASNSKLRERVKRIVQEVTLLDMDKVEPLVEKAEGDARIAILLAKFDITVDECWDALNKFNGHFPKTIHYLNEFHNSIM